LRLRSNSANAMSSSDLCHWIMFNTSFSNKTQLKIFFFVLLGRTRFNAFLTLDRTRFGWNNGECLHCSRGQWSTTFCCFLRGGITWTVEACSTVHVNSGAWLHCSCDCSAQEAAKSCFLVLLVNLRHSHNLWWVLPVKNYVFCLTKQQYMWLWVNLTHNHNIKWPQYMFG